MTDDIVTRLRMPICGNYDDDHPSWGPQPCGGCVEAADEIERLRAYIIQFPCTCQFNKAQCIRCEITGEN